VKILFPISSTSAPSSLPEFFWYLDVKTKSTFEYSIKFRISVNALRSKDSL